MSENDTQNGYVHLENDDHCDWGLMGNLMGICRFVLDRPSFILVWLHGLSSIPVYENIDAGWWFGT